MITHEKAASSGKANLSHKTESINIGGNLMDFGTPKVMGIINVTPDSFYSASRTANADAIDVRAGELLEAGADILDIGGYSSRPGADDVSPEEEYRRLSLALEVIRDNWPDAVISVDTFRAEVARKCVEHWKVDIINDISGGSFDREIWDVAAELKIPYVLMHLRGNPSTMQNMTQYDDVAAEVLSDLAFKLDELHSLGVADVIIDPGFGFAKTVEQNYQLLGNLELFKQLGCPLLAGMSHKTMIWKPLGISPGEALNGTVVLDTVALMKGADILRVHEVKEAVETVKLISCLKKSMTAY